MATTSSSASCSFHNNRYDVYDIDGTLTRPGYDLWYLTSKAMMKTKKEKEGTDGEDDGSVVFDRRVKQWKQEVAETGNVVQASQTMMQDAIRMIATSANASKRSISQEVFETAKSIASDLIRKGLVFSEWISYVKKRMTKDGVTPILATTNYVEGARAFLQALVDADWMTEQETKRFLVSGTVVDWNSQTFSHFNMHTLKAVGVLKATGMPSMVELRHAVENVFGDDPLGNDYGIVMLALPCSSPSSSNDENHDHSNNQKAWVVNTAKNAKLDLPLGMQRMSWLHWTDADKHRMPVGLMGVFGMCSSNNNGSVGMNDASSVSSLPSLPQKRKQKQQDEGNDSNNSHSLPSPTKATENETVDAKMNSAPSHSDDRAQVVIVGAGFCGVVVAKMLQQNDSCEVTLIDPKPYFEYVGALPKSLLQSQEAAASAVSPSGVPLAQALPRTRIVQGWAHSVTGDKRVVVSVNDNGGESRRGQVDDHHSYCGRMTIDYDHLVIATGSTYPAGIKYSHMMALSGVSRSVDLQRQRHKVQMADSILVIGGGLVGVEIATEIKTIHPDKQVTLVDRLPRLFPRIPAAHEIVHKRLQQLQIQLVLGQEASRLDPDTLDYLTESGQRFSCDHAIWCGGPQPNAGTLVPSVKNAFQSTTQNDKDGDNAGRHLVVDEYLKLCGFVDANVWCGGDICQTGSIGEEITAARAIEQGEIIAHNIGEILREKTKGQQQQQQQQQQEGGQEPRLKVYQEHSNSRIGSGKDKAADIASMIVSLGGKRALVVIDDIAVEGPFRDLKEEVEYLFLAQMSWDEHDQELRDPYALLHQVDTEKLEEYAKKEFEPSLRDLLSPEELGPLSEMLRNRPCASSSS